MSILVASSFCVSITACASPIIRRPEANFHPSVWGDHFIQYVSKSTDVRGKVKQQQVTSLKENVREMLIPVDEKALQPVAVANLIDSIQRLGLCYHFEHEIDEILKLTHNNYVDNNNNTITLNEEDLHSIALVFRLLRQHGYYISPDVFNKFKDKEGNFNQRLTNDVEGMLSLYEAAHLRIHGEDILDEALAFTSSHLKSMITRLNSSLAAKVKNSLKRPLRKNMPRLVTKHYISIYEEEPSYDENLLLLAKLDFNMLQKQHQKEVGIISKWWEDLGFAEKMPFARNRIVECYFWILGAYFEPKYAVSRTITTKITALTTAVDDIYDAYGTLDELELFTKAIERWDITCMEFLPEYMKHCYKALLETYEEIEQEMAKEGKEFCVPYSINQIKMMARSYLAEAKWFNSNYTPTVEEYMSVAMVTVGYRLLITTSFIGMGSFVTENDFQWLTEDPNIVLATTFMFRVMDDLVSNEFEQEKDGSAVQCYMKQHGVTKQDAIDEFRRQIESAWKDVNKGCLDPIQIPKPLILRILNFARVVDVLYAENDGFTNSKGSTQKDIEALLLTPCPI